MSTYFIGLDAGGTSTRALLADETGEVVGRGRAEGANAWSSGGSAVDAIMAALQGALGGHDPASVASGCIAVAGGISSVPERGAEVVAGWRSIGLQGAPRIVIDVVAAYAAGTTLPRGLVLTAGTGSVAALISDGEVVRRAGGRGWLVGDEGSAVWLGVEAVRAVVQALDGRASETALTPTVAAELGVPIGAGVDVATRITDAVYSQSPAGLGTLAPHVVAAAAADDAVALGLVDDAVGHLTGTAVAAAGDEDPEVIVLGGSLLIGARPIGDRVRARLSERWPRSAMVEAASGEAGAVSLAIRAHGGTVTPRMLERLRVASAGSA